MLRKFNKIKISPPSPFLNPFSGPLDANTGSQVYPTFHSDIPFGNLKLEKRNTILLYWNIQGYPQRIILK